MKTFSRRWPDRLILLILIMLPLLFFWRLITPNPADRMQIAAGDFTEQYFPLRAFAAREWVQGRVPLWNPYLYGGQPALADIQSGALYPPHVGQALLLGWGGPLLGREVGFPLEALQWQVILHFSVASVGAYLLMRQLARQSGAGLRQARFSGVIAALVFTYGGYLTGFPVQQITILQVSVWLPWVLWGLTLTLPHAAPDEVRRRRPVAMVAALFPRLPWGILAFGLALLAGHPQTVLYIFYLSAAYTIFQAIWFSHGSAVKIFRSERSWGFSAMMLFAPWLLMIILGGMIAAAQLWPTLEFIARSVRADLSYQAVSGGLPLTELIAILYPGFFGGSPEYVGIVSLVLLAFALVCGWTWYRLRGTRWSTMARRYATAQIFFWTGAGLVSLLLSFGDRTFLYPLFYLLAPGFDAVRQQERAFLVYSFSAAIGAGFGAMVLAGPLPQVLRHSYRQFEFGVRRVAVVGVLATGFFIYGSSAATARGDEVNLFFGVLRHHIFGLIILAGLLIWLVLRPRRRTLRPWGLGMLALWLGFNLFTVNWRFNLEKNEPANPFSGNGVTQFLQAKLSQDGLLALPPGRIVSGGLLPGGNSAASVHNLPDLTGNTPLQLAASRQFLDTMPAWRQWQLMAVRYIVDERDIAGEGLTPVFDDGQLRVFEMGDPFPRAWFVSGVEVIADLTQTIDRLAADAFDLRRAAIVAEPLATNLAEPADGGSTVEIQAITPTSLQAEVETSTEQLLVISQIYYPGWRASLNDQPVNLVRANGVLQGVVIPPGRHRLDLNFRPASFLWGSGISIGGLFLWATLLILNRNSLKHKGHEEKTL